MSIARTLAVARHAFHTNLLTPFTRVGLVIVVLVTLLGPAASLSTDGGWEFDPRMLSFGFMFGALFILRSGVVEQRMGGLQQFLRENFVTPGEHIAGAILSLMASWLLLTLFTFLVALAVSAGDLGLAAWLAWVLLLVSGALLPFVLMVECASDLRTPLVGPILVLAIGLFIMAATLGVEQTSRVLGLDLHRTDPASSLPLAARAAVALILGFGMVVLGTRIRDRARATRRRSATAG